MNRESNPAATANVKNVALWVIFVWAATPLLLGLGEHVGNISNPGPWERLCATLLGAHIVLPLGIGTAALIAFFGLLGAQDTFRVPITVSMMVVFFGLLLNGRLSDLVSEDFADTFLWAFTLILGFYFGTEGAVAVFKTRQLPCPESDPQSGAEAETGGTKPKKTAARSRNAATKQTAAQTESAARLASAYVARLSRVGGDAERITSF